MKRISIIMEIALILFGASLIFNNGVQASEKPKEVIYASIADMTGPYAPIVAAANAAFSDAVEYVNGTGGIQGVPINLLVRDSGGKVEIGINHYMQLREMRPPPAMIYVTISSLSEALKERANEDRIPIFSVASRAAIYPVGYTFGAYANYSDQCALFLDWLAETWNAKRPPRLAFLTWDSTYGKAVLCDEVIGYAKSKGIEIVDTALFSMRDVSVTNQLMKIRAKKADWIYTNTLSTGPVLIRKGLKAMGYNAKLASGLGLDDSCLNINREAMEGSVAVHPFDNWSETDRRGIKLMEKYFQKNKRKNTFRTMMYPMGFSGILVFREVAERVVDKYGWDGFNGPNIKKEMERLTDFDADGIGFFSYTPDRHTPNMCKIFQVKGGLFRPITDYRKCPDLRPAQYR